MSQGRSIRLFLVDGTPSGLLTAEIINWSGHVLTGPRSKFAELVQRPECGRTGVYFLMGPDPDGSPLDRVYIGESDDVARRLKEHNQGEHLGGKDFWERACLVTSKDLNLTKAHVKYLETRLIRIAKEAGHSIVINTADRIYDNLPESDQADMAFFLEQIRTVLPTLGLGFLREVTKPSQLQETSSVSMKMVTHSPVFELTSKNRSITAYGQEVNGEFFVLKNSYASEEWTSSPHSYQTLFERVVKEGALSAPENGTRRFIDDYAFNSPSAAAAVVLGRNANGRTSWTVKDSTLTYAQWQDEQVAAMDQPEADLALTE
ncbi:GIY-YIG nuclease family protein [Pseudomonas sp. NMS19W]|uniref:GIY-YIG nuclease family protein n=1 Tax=Pseudomonas sp. NMS19W TaxID=3079768 RepID=UPI003F65A2F9